MTIALNIVLFDELLSLTFWDVIVAGFLATVFANFDVSPEIVGLGNDHSSPGSNQQTATDPHYADVVADEASRTSSMGFHYI